ncbi:MAG: hypothetical protein JRN18_00410 [Nitrososphaerota archaeon]|nr:hypothetical protein [Nitrososphaerota archaeon]MDG6917725.1 hypothetical protein [Nitrososphaerota archaeon]MDG6917893.1 hypothetical protein [Nitrososphaerota archaeon]MDG6946415.1 hypothetical protein [Nitrososphaerota archaeon]MDG6947818.1 hypothetical protein [Nitrososphaerota archaeon]
MKPPITSVEVSYLIHATEDEKKVCDAVARLLGGDPVMQREALEGHFGNRIVRIRIHLTGDVASLAFRHIVAGLPRQVRAAVSDRLAAFVDEHSALYLRLDKQRLISGTAEIGTTDSIRVKVKPRLFAMQRGALEFYSNELEGT